MANPENLKPFTGADDPRRMNGKPKGTKHLSTIIRNIMDNIDWSKTTLKNKEQLEKQYGKKGWEAIVYVAYTKAMTGDPQAMKWLAENGFGKNIDITSGGESLNIIVDSSYAKRPKFRTNENPATSDDLAEDSSQ
jgi:hypothetical protein